jgi:rubrerythrin
MAGSLKTLGDILEAALAREQDACAFYSEALKQASSAPARELLERLKDEEYKHVRILEKKLAELRLA